MHFGQFRSFLESSPRATFGTHNILLKLRNLAVENEMRVFSNNGGFEVFCPRGATKKFTKHEISALRELGIILTEEDPRFG